MKAIVPLVALASALFSQPDAAQQAKIAGGTTASLRPRAFARPRRRAPIAAGMRRSRPPHRPACSLPSPSATVAHRHHFRRTRRRWKPNSPKFASIFISGNRPLCGTTGKAAVDDVVSRWWFCQRRLHPGVYPGARFARDQEVLVCRSYWLGRFGFLPVRRAQQRALVAISVSRPDHRAKNR